MTKGNRACSSQRSSTGEHFPVTQQLITTCNTAMPQRTSSEVCVTTQKKKIRRGMIFPRSFHWGTSRQQAEPVFYSSPALSTWSRCLSLDVLSSKYCLVFNQIFTFKKTQALKQRIYINQKDTRHNPAHTERMPEHAVTTYVVSRYSSLHKKNQYFQPRLALTAVHSH